MKKGISFLSGFLVCAFIVSLSLSALAITGRMTIEVAPINIQVNGAVFQPTDVNGKEVPVFAYQGTTYAPLRALAEAYGLEVGYDAQRNMATVRDPNAPTPPTADMLTSADAIPDRMLSADGQYRVAFITDVGQLKDRSFNQGTYDGVKLYAAANGKSYKYYQPANDYSATDEDRYDAMVDAINNGAEVIVATGFMQEAALKKAAMEYPDIPFVFIDGYPLTDDTGHPLTNVAGISFMEEQSGFLAGYAAVKEGFEKLGFAGGGGGLNPGVCRYGYGFVQGANAAAAEMGKNVEINYTYQYGATFSASPELQYLTDLWYDIGTEIVFVAGGSMFQSVTVAAYDNDGYVIGVDVDQSFEFDSILTSAMKDLNSATQWALTKVYDGTFAEIGGVSTALGVSENAVCLPTATWSMKNYTTTEYQALLAAMKAGTVLVDDTVLENDAVVKKYSNVTVHYI